MSLDERSGAPTFDALIALNVSAMETARAAQVLVTLTTDYQRRLADVHPAAELTESEANPLERLAVILAARAGLVKALVESQFIRDQGDESQVV